MIQNAFDCGRPRLRLNDAGPTQDSAIVHDAGLDCNGAASNVSVSIVLSPLFNIPALPGINSSSCRPFYSRLIRRTGTGRIVADA